MRRVTWIAAAVVLVGVLVGGYVVADTYFLPERATVVSERTSSDAAATVVKAGSFSGKAGHRVSGSVALLEDDDGYALRFEDYRQTQGPDVFVYLTPSSDPDTTSEIRAGRKIRIDGGAGDGESTKEGTFTQRLPSDVDVDRYDGVGVWCDRFSVPFGAAALEAP